MQKARDDPKRRSLLSYAFPDASHNDSSLQNLRYDIRPMPKQSAGLVLYRIVNGETLEVLLVHPGGPYWTKKDTGAWFIPKGELQPGEDPLDAAKREFEEETGMKPEGNFQPLGSVKNKSGKIVTAHGPLKAIATRPKCAATHSRWNGPPSPESSKSSPRWIARNFSNGRSPKQNSFRGMGSVNQAAGLARQG